MSGAVAPAADASAAAATRLHVQSVGAGPPLVLLHGFALHGGVFDGIVTGLARTHRVHVVDLPGHGYSGGVPAVALPQVAELVATAIDAVMAGDGRDLGAPAVLGWSFGGQVAMQWALQRPGHIGRLVLACTTPSFVMRPGWAPAMDAETLRRFGDELRVAWRLTLQRFLTLQVQGSDQGRRTLSQLRTRLFERGQPSAEQLATTLAMLIEADLRPFVASIRVPTLVVTGPRDTLAPAAAGAWLARAMPGAQLTVIDGAAHAPFLSHAAPFTAALAAFLDGR